MKQLTLSFAFLVAVSNSALAADAVIEDVVAVNSAYNWSGVYVGAQLGYAWGESYFYVPILDAYSNPDPDGWVGGVYAGFNHEFSNKVVIGIEGDFAFANVRGDDIGYNTAGIPTPDNRIDADMNWSAAVRGRLGYAFDRFLPYVSAGIAFADYDHSVFYLGNSSGDFGETYTGWTIGAGLDYALTDNVLFRGEYRYSDFESESFPGRPLLSPHNLDLSTNEVRLGIAYKF